MSPRSIKELEKKIKRLEAIVSKQSAELDKISNQHLDDIEEIKNCQKTILKYENRLNESQRIAHVGSWEWDIKNQQQSWSDETYRIFGHEKGSIKNTMEVFLDSIHPDDRAIVLDAAEASLNNNKKYDIEHRIIIPSGEERIVHELAEITFDDSGKTVKITGTVQDITECRKTEEALQKSEERYSFLFKQPTIGVVYINADGIIVDLNEAFGKILDIPYKSLIGFNTIKNIKNEKMKKTIKKALKGNICFFDGEYVSMISGKAVYLHAVMQAQYDNNGKVMGGIGIFEDVTDRHNAEKALKKSDEKLQSIFRTASIGIGLVVERKIKWVNEIFTQITGFSRDELLENNSRILYPSDEEYEKAGKEKYEQIKKYGTGTFETKFMRKDGEEIDILLSSTPLNQNDLNEGVTFTALDITSRKKAENNIKYHLNLKTAISEASKIFISPDNIDIDKVLETIGSAVSADRAYLFRFSFGLQTMSNTNEWCADGVEPEIDNLQNIDTKIIPWWTKKLTNLENIIIDNLEALPEEALMEKELLRAQKIKSLVVVPIILKDKTLWGFMGFDEIKSIRKWHDYEISTLQVISNMIAKYIDRMESEKERKKLEKQLFHSQKMDSIGRLAGGIAHDFNNTLTGIMGYAELLKMKFNDPTSMESEAASVILEGTERAANLTKQLLGFARGGKYLPVNLNINEIIKDTNKLTEMSFSKDIKVTFYLDPDINDVKADKSQMEQVITNLIINAKDAMPLGGHLLYESENVYLDKDYGSKFSNFKPGKYVKFSVLDSGTGIPKELHKKIFEPFFTTKKTGEGVGFGLATVYGIIKNHEGYIELFSEINEGSRFTVYLPSVENNGTNTLNITERAFNKSNGELVMIVDDEKEVRKITRKQLEYLGYKVISASDGKEAVSVYETRKNEIDLVLLDVIMPELDGLDTFKILKKMNPDIKTIVISGFSKKGKASDLLNLGAQGFVQKPFRIIELSKMISDILKK